jgi:hypothetical protein
VKLSISTPNPCPSKLLWRESRKGNFALLCALPPRAAAAGVGRRAGIRAPSAVHTFSSALPLRSLTHRYCPRAPQSAPEPRLNTRLGTDDKGPPFLAQANLWGVESIPPPCPAPEVTDPCLALIRKRHVRGCTENYVSQRTSRRRRLESTETCAHNLLGNVVYLLLRFEKTYIVSRFSNSSNRSESYFKTILGQESSLQRRSVRHHLACLNLSPDHFLISLKVLWN